MNALILRVGGKDDPLAFTREASELVAEPPSPGEAGAPEDALLLQRMAYETGFWTADVWEANWLEAAGRCRTCGVSPQVFMANVVDLFEISGRTAPLPWIADSLTPREMIAFLPRHKADRKNAWGGGLCRSDPTNPGSSRLEYDFLIGCMTAEAAAKGCTTFRNRSCLLCAAGELRLIPELITSLPWTGEAEQLATLMEQLAERTERDDPPIRGIACGQTDCYMASYLRCLYGNMEGVFCLGHSGDDPSADFRPNAIHIKNKNTQP